ncbi:MAG: hypothetical protein Q9220_007356 [cf. Caloplaca sp. 1 TL-2023]
MDRAKECTIQLSPRIKAFHLPSSIKRDSIPTPSPDHPVFLNRGLAKMIVALEQWRSTLLSTLVIKGLKGPVDCTICIDKHKLIVRLPCKHIFGKKCAEKWLGQPRNSCPICRAQIFDEDLCTLAASNSSSGIETTTSSRTPWTAREERLVMDLKLDSELSWAEIVEYLPGRTVAALKARWPLIQQRYDVSGSERYFAETSAGYQPWTEEERRILGKFSCANITTIRTHLSRRTEGAIRAQLWKGG